MNRWKRMYKFLIPLALALSFVGLSRCGVTEMAIEEMALQYLSEQYSAEFTIVNWWREPREKSPIPSIMPSYNFELEVISDLSVAHLIRSKVGCYIADSQKTISLLQEILFRLPLFLLWRFSAQAPPLR